METEYALVGLASDRVCHCLSLLKSGIAPKASISPCLLKHKVFNSGIFSVTLSVALRPPIFHWYLLLRSPDFPLLFFQQKSSDDFSSQTKFLKNI
ncbi:Uncharacterized protein PRO82_001566 [Candidatus Protochlamydia amoebophila]|nr:Uncharacterized protein [Candidatus Protochlamydia amoebophila]